MPKDPTVERLRAYLGNYGRKYPAAWRQVEQMVLGKGKDLARWPDWCFLPMAGIVAIMSQGKGHSSEDMLRIIGPENASDIAVLAALSAWRVGQGIYRFDPDLLGALFSTTVDKLPNQVLFHLPQWCIYIDTPTLVEKSHVQGLFVHLEYDMNSRSPELRLLVDLEEGLVPVILDLSRPTLSEAMNEILKKQVPKEIVHLFEGAIPEYFSQVLGDEGGLIQGLVSLVIYLCSVNADLKHQTDPERRPERPKPTKTQKGMRFFPPDRPSEWQVGFRIGSSLREARERAERDLYILRIGDGETDRKPPSPHIRRAHWHSYWTGKQANRKLVVKWLPPIPVAIGKDTLVPTIHPVEGP